MAQNSREAVQASPEIQWRIGTVDEVCPIAVIWSIVNWRHKYMMYYITPRIYADMTSLLPGKVFQGDHY